MCEIRSKTHVVTGGPYFSDLVANGNFGHHNPNNLDYMMRHGYKTTALTTQGSTVDKSFIIHVKNDTY